MQQDSSTPINDFVVDDCFADDDLITSETEIKGNFLELLAVNFH